MDHLSLFFSSLFMALTMSAPYLVLGYIAAALIKEYVSRELLARHLGDKGVRPVLNAVGIGALLPICSCRVIPLGVGVYRAGACRPQKENGIGSLYTLGDASVEFIDMKDVMPPNVMNLCRQLPVVREQETE